MAVADQIRLTQPMPERNQTLVLPLDAQEVVKRLERITRQEEDAATGSHQMHGIIDTEGFCLSPILQQPNNYVPRLVGRIEATSRGSIVFLSYQLYGSTQIFLWVGTILLFLLGLAFALLFAQYAYALLTALAMGFNYWIALVSFERQVQQMHQNLYAALTNPLP
ncbi:MAG: hypothetical protein ACFCUI_08255 [Bernardetiaceae bacterium]